MTPTVKRMMRDLHIDKETATKVRKLMTGELDPLTVPACAQWVRQCYHSPHHVEAELCAIDAVLGTHGVEGLGRPGRLSPHFSYCNTGDSYATTVCYNHIKRRYEITSWGDLVEGGKVRGE